MVKASILSTKQLVLGALFSSLVFLLYLRNLSPTVYSGDSGDLILAAVKLGVPHPPGYPFYTLLGHLFSLIPLDISPAWKLNLMSAFFEAATVFIVFLIICLLTKRLFIAFLGSGILAFSYTFWFYGEFAEVFPLNNFLSSLAFLFAILHQKEKKSLFLYLFAFSFGMAFSHHQTSILFLPLYVALFWDSRKVIFKPKSLFYSLTLFTLPFLFYFYPLISSTFFKPPIAWDEPSNFFDLVHLFTRADYGTFKATLGAFESPPHRISQIILYWRFFVLDFSFLGAILLVLGFLALFKSSRILSLGMFLSFVMSGALFLSYANFPLTGTYEILVSERFSLLSFILAIVVISCGLSILSDYIAAIFGGSTKSVRIKMLLIQTVPVAFLVFPAVLLITNIQKTDLSDNFLGRTLIEDLFVSTDKNAIVFLRSDPIVFNSWYLHFVENLRPDLKLLTGHLPINWYYQKTLPRVYPDLIYPQEPSAQERLASFIKSNVSSHSVYFYVPPVVIDGFVWVPEGLVHKLYPKNKVPTNKEVKEKNEKFWSTYRIAKNAGGYRDLLSDFAVELYSEGRVGLGNYFFFQKDYKEAREEYLLALAIDPDVRSARLNLGFSNLLLGDCHGALEEFSKTLAREKFNERASTGVILTYRDCLHDEEKAKEFENKFAKEKEKLLNFPTLEKF